MKVSKFLELDMEDQELICNVGKALSSPIRIEILKLLYGKSLIIGEIANALDIPASSAAMHVRTLEAAQLIRFEELPGTRGKTKLCHRKPDFINISLLSKDRNVDEIVSAEMPVGAFCSCDAVPTCGLADIDGVIGTEDVVSSFYLPQRANAQLLWSSGGVITYRFPNLVPKKYTPKRLNLTMEICSEAPNYRLDWKSDITLWVNGIDCGYWQSPSDYGARRGRLNPAKWPDGSTQYGVLVSWEVNENGIYINNEHIRSLDFEALNIMEQEYIEIKIGNKADAQYVGGFNIFGKRFGDYAQDLILSIEY